MAGRTLSARPEAAPETAARRPDAEPPPPKPPPSAGAGGKAQNLQDLFLNLLRKNKTPVTMFLVKGVKLQGIVTWFDNFSILLRRDGQSQLVYKHAISTIMPSMPLDARQFVGSGEERQEAAAAAGRVPVQRPRCGGAGDDVPGQRRDAAGPDRRL